LWLTFALTSLFPSTFFFFFKFQFFNKMAFLRIGDTCPNFDAKSQFGDFNLYEYLGEGWGIIFSHPADFTRESKTKKKKILVFIR
jgi:hypothetical protein